MDMLESGSENFEGNTVCTLEDIGGGDRFIQFVCNADELALAAAYAAQFPNNFFESRGIAEAEALGEIRGQNLCGAWLLESNAATDLLLSIFRRDYGATHSHLEADIGNRRDGHQELEPVGDKYVLGIYYGGNEE